MGQIKNIKLHIVTDIKSWLASSKQDVSNKTHNNNNNNKTLVNESHLQCPMEVYDGGHVEEISERTTTPRQNNRRFGPSRDRRRTTPYDSVVRHTVQFPVSHRATVGPTGHVLCHRIQRSGLENTNDDTAHDQLHIQFRTLCGRVLSVQTEQRQSVGDTFEAIGTHRDPRHSVQWLL